MTSILPQLNYHEVFCKIAVTVQVWRQKYPRCSQTIMRLKTHCHKTFQLILSIKAINQASEELAQRAGDVHIPSEQLIHFNKVEMQNRVTVMIHHTLLQMSEINSITWKLDKFRIFHLQTIQPIMQNIMKVLWGVHVSSFWQPCTVRAKGAYNHNQSEIENLKLYSLISQ